ncbi:MAG TPA: PEPxxWA-CTERM sorting domain-containing protein [Phenylobacterium sp.]|nr:PEPxxWA-CTERM sorting domain-containing protein [Phenylobacterium sp.]
MKSIAIILSGLALVAAQPASAAVINSLPGGVAQVMPALEAFTAGPVTFGDITYASTNSYGVIGYTGGYGFGSNGMWYGNPMAGLNTGVGEMTFTFATPLSAILADLNWAPGNGGAATMSIYNAADQLLETLQLDDGFANNFAPGYFGFQRAQGDIAKLTLSNDYIGAQNFSLVTGVAGVPEPGTWALMLVGFGGAGLALRNRRRALVAA